MKQVCVIGLGYVGLPLAQRASEIGYKVVGIDKNKELFTRLRKDELFFLELSNSSVLVNDSDIILICVPTPINADKTPDLSYINEALTELGKHLRKGQLVSIESTVYPGYCETIGREILESASGLKAGEGFYLVHCPERVNPGDENWNVSNIPRVIGGNDTLSLEKGVQFYQTITKGNIHSVNNMGEAEASKMVENAFRDINIAFVNELAKSFDDTNIDIMNVINASATKPFGYMPFYPGLGVGGHCIPVDPEYLINAAKSRGFDHEILKVARHVNDGMIQYIADKLDKLCSSHYISKPNILILGLAYKPNVGDVRESQAVRLNDLLISRGYPVKAYDPFVSPAHEISASLLNDAEVVILATAHNSFNDLVDQLNNCPKIKLIIDTTNKLDSKLLEFAQYSGVGR
jgi:UDP-N-acetyl-D-glucosamine dehydrogenase